MGVSLYLLSYGIIRKPVEKEEAVILGKGLQNPLM
jgi:hypothetical protein